jgi:hypothetical protein
MGLFGLFDRLLRNMPGSPRSVAKTMLRAYTIYKTDHPKSSKKDALRYTLETRYKIIKAMEPEKMESILSEADTLGHLVFLVVDHENPTAAHPMMMKQTVVELYEFFKKHTPEELGGLGDLMKLVSVGQ